MKLYEKEASKVSALQQSFKIVSWFAEYLGDERQCL